MTESDSKGCDRWVQEPVHRDFIYPENDVEVYLHVMGSY